MRFEPANEAFLRVVYFAYHLYSGWSDALVVAASQGTVAHAEIFRRFNYRQKTKTRFICHWKTVARVNTNQHPAMNLLTVGLRTSAARDLSQQIHDAHVLPTY